MTIYNVKTSVVALIDAENESAAIAELHRLLRREGFEPYDGDEPEAFESEPVPPEWVDNLGHRPGCRCAHHDALFYGKGGQP